MKKYNEFINESINWNNRLLELTIKGDLNGVINAIDNGADVHYDNDHSLTVASYKGYLDIVEYLVYHGADIHSKNDYAIRWSSSNGHLDVVKFLVERGADIHVDNDYAIKWASFSGHLDVANYLFEYIIEHNPQHIPKIIQYATSEMMDKYPWLFAAHDHDLLGLKKNI